MTFMCDNEKAFCGDDSAQVMETLLQFGVKDIALEFMNDSRFQMYYTLKSCLSRDKERVATFLIGELNKQGGSHILLSAIEWAVPRQGHGFVIITDSNTPFMMRMIQQLVNYPFEENYQNDVESAFFFILKYLDGLKQLEFLKVMRQSPVLPVLRENRAMSTEWYRFLGSYIICRKENYLRFFIGCWPQFSERINFINVPANELSLMKIALNNEAGKNILTMLCLNADIFDSLIDNSNPSRTQFYIDLLPKAMSECCTSTDPAENTYAGYVHKLMQTPETGTHVMILCYMVDPDIVSVDDLVLSAVRDQNEPAIMAAMEQGRCNSEHISIIHTGNMRNAKIVAVIDREFPFVDLQMCYRDKGSIISEFILMHSSSYYLIVQDLADLMKSAKTLGCMSFLIKFDAVYEKYMLMREFLHTIPEPLHHLLKRDPATINAPDQITYLVDHYYNANLITITMPSIMS